MAKKQKNAQRIKQDME